MEWLPAWLGNPLLWEGIAVLLALAYLLLATRENILCWYCALASTAIYSVLFLDVSLLMESALNVYYMVMAVYGWYQWNSGGEQHQGVSIRRLALSQHVLLITATVALSAVSGFFLSEHSSAVWPYVDSLTTWFSVVTTYMVARKILENWLYWIVIDAVSIPLYIDRGLQLTALLFVAYIAIAVYGYVSWHRHFVQQSASAHA
jgi:nicotinamide mononucleotide transporter